MLFYDDLASSFLNYTVTNILISIYLTQFQCLPTKHCSHSVAAASKCVVFSSQTKWKFDVILFSTLFTWHRFYLTTLIPWLFFSILILNRLNNQFGCLFLSFIEFFAGFICSSKSLMFAIFFRWNSIFHSLPFRLIFWKIYLFLKFFWNLLKYEKYFHQHFSVSTISNNGQSRKIKRKKEKKHHLPSLFMPICRHFLSRQAWHWFRCALSTIHRPVPAWHLVFIHFVSSEAHGNLKEIHKKKQIKTWDWWQNKAESNIKAASGQIQRCRHWWFERVFNQIRKASASNLHFDWKNWVKTLAFCTAQKARHLRKSMVQVCFSLSFGCRGCDDGGDDGDGNFVARNAEFGFRFGIKDNTNQSKFFSFIQVTASFFFLHEITNSFSFFAHCHSLFLFLTPVVVIAFNLLLIHVE